MHANYLGALERGEIPSPGLATIDRVACGLGVSIAVLAESYATAPSDRALRVDTTGGRPERRAPGYDAQALGEAIRIVRRHLDITQAQLAGAIGLHRNQVGSIEVGEKSSRGIATIARVAHGLTLQLGADEPPLLPLLAQVFNGEATLAEVRERFSSSPSGSSDARTVPQVGADD